MMYKNKIYRHKPNELWIKTKKGRKKLKIMHNRHGVSIASNYANKDSKAAIFISKAALQFLIEAIESAKREIEVEEILEE